MDRPYKGCQVGSYGDATRVIISKGFAVGGETYGMEWMVYGSDWG